MYAIAEVWASMYAAAETWGRSMYAKMEAIMPMYVNPETTAVKSGLHFP